MSSAWTSMIAGSSSACLRGSRSPARRWVRTDARSCFACLVQAVYAHERANANRHERVRMSLWEPLRLRLRSRRKVNAHATSMSTDDLCIVSRHSFRIGERVHVTMDDNGSGVRIEAWATVSDAEPDTRGNVACTLLFDDLD